MKLLIECPICKSRKIVRYGKKRLIRKDKPISLVDAEDQFLLERLKRTSLIRSTSLCFSCSFLFQNPTYDNEDLKNIYGNKGKGITGYYKEMENSGKDAFLLTLAQQNLKRRQKRYAESIVNLHGTSILDYGGGNGINLVHPLLKDTKRYVYDFGKDTRLEKDVIAIKNLEIEDHFDFILNTHVLEHEPDPQATLRKLRQLITPAGHLYLEVPFEYSERLLTRRPGAIWHVNYFNRKTIIEIAERTGWFCETIKIKNLPYGHFSITCIIATLRPASKGLKKRKRSFENIQIVYDVILSLFMRLIYDKFHA